MESDDIFVFGSNLAGIHGAGAAKAARERWGAKIGEGIGRTGMSYAIPTKDYIIQTLELERIKPHIDVFIDYARSHLDNRFLLSRIGCGYAGYDWDKDILPMFPRYMPENIKVLEFNDLV